MCVIWYFMTLGDCQEGKELYTTKELSTEQSAETVANVLFQPVMWPFTNIKLMTYCVADVTKHAKEIAWSQLHMK